MGRKATGPVMMGSGVAQQQIKSMLKLILSLRGWAFYLGKTNDTKLI
jgi:hypothetical protein